MEAINYLFMTLPYAMAVALALLVMSLIVWFQRNFAVGAMAIVLTFVLNAVLLSPGGFQVGVTLYLPDLTFILVALATVARLTLVSAARIGYSAFYVLATVVAVNLLQGLGEFGTAAGVSVRPTFYASVACAYALSFPMTGESFRGMVRAAIIGGLSLFALAAFRGVAVALDIRAWLPEGGSFQPAGHSIWRVIVSSETLLLGEASLLLWMHSKVAPAWAPMRVLAPVLMMAVVALQHRSVWLALLAGILGVQAMRICASGGGIKRIGPLLLVVALVGVGAMLAGGDGKVAGDIGKSARDALELRGTAGERLGSWQQLVRNWMTGGPRGLAIGIPFGKSIERYASDDFGARKIEYQPHNYYVELLVGQGLLGLGAWLTLFAAAIRGLWRARIEPAASGEAELLLMLLGVQMAYYLTYGVDYVQVLFLGAALSWVRSRPVVASMRNESAARPPIGSAKAQ